MSSYLSLTETYRSRIILVSCSYESEMYCIWVGSVHGLGGLD